MTTPTTPTSPRPADQTAADNHHDTPSILAGQTDLGVLRRALQDNAIARERCFALLNDALNDLLSQYDTLRVRLEANLDAPAAVHTHQPTAPDIASAHGLIPIGAGWYAAAAADGVE